MISYVSTCTQNERNFAAPQLKRGNPLPTSALPSLLDAILHAKLKGISDRKILLEHMLTLLSRLSPAPPPSSREYSLQVEIQNAVIGLFYDALPHPPITFVPSMMLEAKVPTYIG
jgi:linoleate 10R-lipoxygenase